jgi:hypothetical protein
LIELKETAYYEAILRNKVAQEIAFDQKISTTHSDRRFFKDLYAIKKIQASERKKTE